MDQTVLFFALMFSLLVCSPVRAQKAGPSNNLYLSEVDNTGGELVFLNLSSQSQEGRILSWKSGVQTPEIRLFQLAGRANLRILDSGLSGSALSIQAPYNLAAFIKKESKGKRFDSRPNHRDLPKAQGVRFVVADEGRGASYLVDIINPDMIAQARRQIKFPDQYMARILIAEIGVDKDGENINYLNKLKSPWSWRIVSPIRFAELASQSCDGHPQLVEEQLEHWLTGERTGGRPIICFWGFQVVEELP